MLSVAPLPVAELLSTRAIRERCANITRAVESGHSNHFRIDRTKLMRSTVFEAITRPNKVLGR